MTSEVGVGEGTLAPESLADVVRELAALGVPGLKRTSEAAGILAWAHFSDSRSPVAIHKDLDLDDQALLMGVLFAALAPLGLMAAVVVEPDAPAAERAGAHVHSLSLKGSSLVPARRTPQPALALALAVRDALRLRRSTHG